MASQPDKAPSGKQQPAAQQQPAPTAANAPNKQPNSDTNQPKPSGNPPAGNTPIERPQVWWHDSNWALVLIGLITAGVIGWQSWETRKAAEAGAESARAALLSAHASVNAERAQLLFVTKKLKGDRHGKAIFEIWVKNFGKTPARLVGWRPQNEVFVSDAKNLPIPPVYDGLYAIEGYLIPQGEILVASYDPFQPGHMVQRIAVSKTDNIGVHEVQAVVYGQVEYLDGITHDRQTSRYCFRFEREPFSNIGGSIEPCGPPEYNLCT
jgi:hypothetical protein